MSYQQSRGRGYFSGSNRGGYDYRGGNRIGSDNRRQFRYTSSGHGSSNRGDDGGYQGARFFGGSNRGHGHIYRGSEHTVRGDYREHGRGTLRQMEEQFSQISVGQLKTVKIADNNALIACERQRQWFGTVGEPLPNIITNFFSVNLNPEVKPFSYRVDIFLQTEDKKKAEVISEREIKNRFECRDIFWKFVNMNQDKFGGKHNVIYDDANRMFSLKRLLLNSENILRLKAVLDANTGAPRDYLLIIKLINDDWNRLHFFNYLNILVTQYARCPIEILGLKAVYCERDRFFNIFTMPQANHDYLDLGPIEFLKGIRAFMKKGPGSKNNSFALANFTVVHSSFAKIRVDILQFYALVKGVDLNEAALRQLRDYGLSEFQRRELKSLLMGINLKMREEIGAPVRYYKLTDVLTDRADRYPIEYIDHNNQRVRVSLVRYYQLRYNYTIRFQHMPLLLCGPREKNLVFPIEVLRISETYQRIKKLLPEYFQTQCTSFTTKVPRNWFNDIHRMLKETEFDNNGTQIDPFLNNFDVKIDPRMLQIDGRILDKPNVIEVLRKQQQPSDYPIVFSLLVMGKCDFHTVGNTFANIIQGCRIRKLNVATNQPFETPRNFPDMNSFNFETFLNERLKVKERKHRDALMVLVVVVSNQDDSVYNHIKQICELKVGVISQFLQFGTLARKIANQDPSRNRIVDNIVRKINAKVGGVNNKIEKDAYFDKFTSTSRNQCTLIIGVDVTHPAPGDNEFPSIACIVGSIDHYAVKYEASIRCQERRRESVKYMEEMVEERIRSYARHNAEIDPKANRILPKYPAHIVIFRDGVSESQFDIVRDEEWTAAQNACKKISPQYDPTFTIIIVQKRHSTRFWARGLNHPNAKNENIPPGTVIDRHITQIGNNPEPNKQTNPICNNEFYLCSHTGLLGTSEPSRYNVIVDEWGLEPDEIQNLCYSLCYLYAPTSMPVSIPAPVYYADKACYRARKHYWSKKKSEPSHKLDDPKCLIVHEDLTNSMYFI